jgi:hypothetical protein
MKRIGIDKICTYLEEKKLSVEEVIRIAFYAGNLEGNKEIIVLFPAIVRPTKPPILTGEPL